MSQAQTRSTQAPADHERVNILGIGVSAVNLPTAVSTIAGWIARREPNFVCVRDVHGIVASLSDPQLQRIHSSSGLVTPDGMPLVWFCRLSGFEDVERVYGPDLLLAVCEASLKTGWRHYFYGGASGVATRLAERLEQRFPGLQVAGTFAPPFRCLTEDEENEVARAIMGSRADIVWVGLSTPKQEKWMADHVARLSTPVLIGVGAAFDYHAGTKAQAPRWIQRTGLEWFFRLMTEPKRLWRRYIFGIPVFLAHLLLQVLGLRDYPSGSTEKRATERSP